MFDKFENFLLQRAKFKEKIINCIIAKFLTKVLASNPYVFGNKGRPQVIFIQFIKNIEILK